MPKRGAEQTAESYVLTLRTSSELHESMNALRNVYFPTKLNRVAAHLTLFHALPQSMLETDVIPAVQKIAASTGPYRIRAGSTFRLSKGVAIRIEDDIDHAKDSKQGRNMTRQIHARLRHAWKSWLSEQDSAPVRLHYTVMNKVADQELIDEAVSQISDSLAKHEMIDGASQHDQDGDCAVQKRSLELDGVVTGLTLWRYNRGTWAEPREFAFEMTPN